MKRKTAPRKPKVSPQTAGGVLAALRWEKTTSNERSKIMTQVVTARWAKRTAAERSEEMRQIAARPRQGDRCPCGAMTLKRAEARGRTWEHEPGCSFHPGAERGSHAN